MPKFHINIEYCSCQSISINKFSHLFLSGDRQGQLGTARDSQGQDPVLSDNPNPNPNPKTYLRKPQPFEKNSWGQLVAYPEATFPT